MNRAVYPNVHGLQVGFDLALHEGGSADETRQRPQNNSVFKHIHDLLRVDRCT